MNSVTRGLFMCGHCEWNADGTIRHLSFDCPVHDPHDARAFPARLPKRSELSYDPARWKNGAEAA